MGTKSKFSTKQNINQTEAEKDKSIEKLTQEYIERLMRFPGFYVRCPMPLSKGEPDNEWKKIANTICENTSTMLTMMGIKHSHDPLYSVIKVEDI